MKESITIRFIRAVRRTIAAHQMIGEGETLLVAVSGGPDSMALLHVLQELTDGLDFRLGVAHLNHGLRPGAAEADEAFVCRIAAAMGVPYFTETADVPAIRKARRQSVEEAAREVRYRFLSDVAETNGFTAVALGHHANDNAELVLMNLLRGSGPHGLSGMAPKRVLLSAGPGQKAIHLIRPLIGIHREDILAYDAENGIPSIMDQTNSDLRYRRNRIRNELMPLLRNRYNPNIIDTLNRTAEILRSERHWILSRLPLDHDDPDPAERVELPRSHICRVHPAEARQHIRTALQKAKGNLRRIGFRHIESVMALAARPEASGSLDLPDRIRVTACGEKIFFAKESHPLRQIHPRAGDDGPAYFEHVLPAPGSLFVPEAGIFLRADILPPGTRPDYRNAGHRTAFFDMEAVTFPLTVRSPKPGDRFTPLGMAGRQKVKKYFVDHKIPPARRARCPVLESGGRLVWLMGCRIDDSVKITTGTQQVLKIEFNLA